jgi:hypothetical protein
VVGLVVGLVVFGIQVDLMRSPWMRSMRRCSRDVRYNSRTSMQGETDLG